MKLPAYAKYVAWAVVGAVFILLWTIAETGRHMTVHDALPWYPVLAVVGVAIAVCPLVPVVSMGALLGVLLTQLADPVAQFSEDNWPVYFGFVAVVGGFSAFAKPRWRRLGLIITAVFAVLTSILRVLPMAYWMLPSNLRLSLVVNVLSVLAVALGLYALSWLVGRAFRTTQSASPPALELAAGPEALSDREREVFKFAAEGLSNSEIAAQAFISEATVKSHMTRILAKLGLTSRAQLVAYAWRNDMVDAKQPQ